MPKRLKRMAVVLAISSFVSRGSVGLRAVVPALEQAGHEVFACPSVLLSNHLGHRHTAGSPVDLDTFSAVFEALEGNGWLAGVDAVLTGYMPSAEHILVAAGLIDRLRGLQSDVPVFCDPVLGDLPGGRYVSLEVAEATRAELLPRATYVKPNLFELAYLSGMPVDSMTQPEDVVAAARALAAGGVLASSIPLAGNRLGNILVTPDEAFVSSVEREPSVPHGTGDLLAAVFAAEILAGASSRDATAAATAMVAAAIARSEGRDELQLSGMLQRDNTVASTMTQLA